jgi:alkylation response protein AidB-like acyl-CoA dehydrogenase
MNFDLTEERQMLSDTLRRYLSDKYDTKTRNEILESAAGYSADIWSELAGLGVIGALFAEDQGGFGGGGFDIAVVFEELGRAGVVEPFLDTAVLAGGLIAALGSSEMVEDLIAGEIQLAFAHGEPQSRYDICDVQTEVTLAGDELLLSGRKAVVINAEAADQLVVSAKEDDGISLFLVSPLANGVTLQGYPVISGGRAAEVILENAPATRLGAAGAALPVIETMIARASVAQMAECLGAMSTAVDLTQDYLLTRQQFGRPLASFQALQHRMADMLTELEQARSALFNAAGHLGADPHERARQISAAKSLFGRIGRLIAEESIQMHGGIAMTQEYELAHIAKRIVMADHRFGDEDWHLERFIALSAA